MCLSWVPSRRHLTVTGDNWRYLSDEKCRFLETSFMTFTLYKHIIMKSELIFLLNNVRLRGRGYLTFANTSAYEI